MSAQSGRPANDNKALEPEVRHGRRVLQHLSEDDPNLDRLDAALADSFPASDPPAMLSPNASAAPEQQP